MTDEVTESSNPEQLVLCFQWADVDLYCSQGLCWDKSHRKHKV